MRYIADTFNEPEIKRDVDADPCDKVGQDQAAYAPSTLESINGRRAKHGLPAPPPATNQLWGSGHAVQTPQLYGKITHDRLLSDPPLQPDQDQGRFNSNGTYSPSSSELAALKNSDEIAWPHDDMYAQAIKMQWAAEAAAAKKMLGARIVEQLRKLLRIPTHRNSRQEINFFASDLMDCSSGLSCLDDICLWISSGRRLYAFSGPEPFHVTCFGDDLLSIRAQPVPAKTCPRCGLSISSTN